MFDDDVVLVDTDQGGLATGHALRNADLSHVPIETDEPEAVGTCSHGDPHPLFSPAWFCVLPGLAFPGERCRFRGRDAAVVHLGSYAASAPAPRGRPR